MPEFLLRRNAVVTAYPDEFLVIMPMADGYELEVGHVSQHTASQGRRSWAWATQGGNGQSPTREEAMAALKTSWDATDDDIARMRRQQEWTECKYALFDAGYKAQIADGAIHCPCGVTFDPSDHDATMAHIGHITGRNR